MFLVSLSIDRYLSRYNNVSKNQVSLDTRYDCNLRYSSSFDKIEPSGQRVDDLISVINKVRLHLRQLTRTVKLLNRTFLQIQEKGFVMDTNQKTITPPEPFQEQQKNQEPTLTELEWLDPKQLERFYRISVNRQKRLRVERKLPFSKFGAYVRYSKEKINELFVAHEVEVA